MRTDFLLIPTMLAVELHEVLCKRILNKLLLVVSVFSKDLYQSCLDNNLPELSEDPTKANSKVLNNSHSTSEVSEILQNNTSQSSTKCVALPRRVLRYLEIKNPHTH